MCDMTATRRHFLTSTAALLAGSRFASAKTLKVIGVQLYTLRNVINDKPLEILQALQKIGYTEVEVIRGNMDKIWPALKQTSLKPVSLHVDTAYFTKEQDKLQATFEDAKQKGFQYMVCPYIAPADRGGPEVMKKLADTLNKAGERAKKLGMNLAYHNHAFEFAPSGEGTLLDILMKETDPKLVALELDIMWSQVAGVDPVSVLQKYKGRVALMHVKDVEKGTAQRFNEQVPRSAFKEAGKGMVDLPAVLRAASAAGVKHYFVEQDQVPGDPLESLKISYDYLHKLTF